MATKLPYLKLYIGDLKKELTYTCLSLSSKGLWLEMLFIMHNAEPRGYLPMDLEQISRMSGGTEKEVKKCLSEMERVGTFSKTEGGVIFNRRMVREAGISEVRSSAGKSSASTKAQQKLNKSSTKEATKEATNHQQNCDDDIDIESGLEKGKDGDTETIRTWLEEFTEGKFGVPSDAIVLKMLSLLGESPIECFQEFLIDLHTRKLKPNRSYGWFISLAEDYFGGLKNGRK